MKKWMQLLFLLCFMLMFSSCGADEVTNLEKSPVKKGTMDFKGLEQYLGKTAQEFSEGLGLEIDISYSGEGDDGNPEYGFLETKLDKLLYANLYIDDFKKKYLQDHELYIGSISIELPYENIAGIKKDDDRDTVRKKLTKAGIDYDDSNDEQISYVYGDCMYTVEFFSDDFADQIQCREWYESKNYSKKKFDQYCAAFPGGFYMDNGDYLVVIDQGLLSISSETAGYSCKESENGGTIDQTQKGLVYTSSDGARFSIDRSNGQLTYIMKNDLVAQEQNVPEESSATRNPLVEKYKDTVRKYLQYASDKWGYNTKRSFDLADFNGDGLMDLYSIADLSSPTPGTMRQSIMEVYSLIEDEVKLIHSTTVAEPLFEGGTEFINYYIALLPGEGDYIITDSVSTRFGTGHVVSVCRIKNMYQLDIIDYVEFSYPNDNLINGEGITDYPRVAELLSKYSVNYDNILIGLGPDYSLLFSPFHETGSFSFEYFRQLLSGDKDSEILYRLTGEWPQ